MKTLAFLLSLFTFAPSFAAKVNKAVDVNVGGETRQYWLYVPNNVKKNCPMVMALHGASGKMTDNSPRFNEIADREGFIVVYPQGKPIYFPVFGGTVTGWNATGEDNADVDFIKAVIEDVASRYTIDRKRLYCCGFSNGGMMTYALSNTCSDIFAAFAAISGFPLNEFHLHHTGARPVPFLHIHGKKDDFVRYALMPVIVDEMVERLGANPIPVKTSVTGKYDKSIYEAADGSFPYTYYEIDDMGHNDYTGNIETGNSSQVMWNHFKQYSLDTPCDTTLKWRPRIETEGYDAKSHGWTVGTGLILLRFGGDQNTDGKQNVYRSLQLDNGSYKLRFNSTGDEGKEISVKLQKLTGRKNYLLKTSVPVGQEACLTFQVEDGWGEYKLTLSRSSSADQISVSDVGIYSLTADEAAAIKLITPGQTTSATPGNTTNTECWDISGLRRTTHTTGVQILRTADGRTRKVLAVSLK